MDALIILSLMTRNEKPFKELAWLGHQYLDQADLLVRIKRDSKLQKLRKSCRRLSYHDEITAVKRFREAASCKLYIAYYYIMGSRGIFSPRQYNERDDMHAPFIYNSSYHKEPYVNALDILRDIVKDGYLSETNLHRARQLIDQVDMVNAEPDVKALLEECRELAKTKPMEAVKRFRDKTGVGLREAHNAVLSGRPLK